jgi:ElaB/YqjD/DUF883 family membrane-anchored ribosome-binding protein
MTKLKSLREEFEELRTEILAKRAKSGEAAIPEAHDEVKVPKPEASLEHQIGELNRMVKTMLDDAETTVTDYPVATVAGGLALGIVIGRLTAR